MCLKFIFFSKKNGNNNVVGSVLYSYIKATGIGMSMYIKIKIPMFTSRINQAQSTLFEYFLFLFYRICDLIFFFIEMFHRASTVDIIFQSYFGRLCLTKKLTCMITIITIIFVSEQIDSCCRNTYKKSLVFRLQQSNSNINLVSCVPLLIKWK